MKMEKRVLKDLPKSIRRRYNAVNGLRTVTMFIGWAITAIVAVLTAIDGDFTVIGAVCFGGVIHGWIHAGFLFKDAFAKTGLVLGFIVSAFIFIGASLIGGVFLVIDTVRFIQKKPLIYNNEDKYFLDSETLVSALVSEGKAVHIYDVPDDDE